VPSRFGDASESALGDLVVCRHVIEHVPDPVSLVAAIGEHLADGGAVVIETPCVEWILRNVVVWDFFYEHCSLFSRSSLGRLLADAGLGNGTVEHVFNGQYLLAISRAVGDGPAPSNDVAVIAECRRFKDEEAAVVARWRSTAESARSRGPVAVWGAGAKGSTFSNLIDPGGSLFACLVDVNPRKQGRFAPGTGHPIVAPAELEARGISTVIIMNPNYEAEVRAALDEIGARAEVICG
jgi:hypothetical protein